MVAPVPGPKMMKRLPDGYPSVQPTTFTLDPMSPTLGAEVGGVDLAQPLSDLARSEMFRALLEWKLLVFRDQRITPAHHVEFALRFGDLFDDSTDVERKQDPMDNYVQFVREPGSAGLDNVWHTDGSFRPDPPVALTLHSIEVPDVGGDTLFADMAVAYDNLSDTIKDRIETLEAKNDWSVGYYAQTGFYGERFDAIAESLPPVHHPVARRHPVTGRRILYANRAFTASLLNGDDELFELLRSQVEVPEYQVRLRWRPGTFVMFDNQALQHYATNNFLPNRRVMGRATIERWHPDVAVLGAPSHGA